MQKSLPISLFLILVLNCAATNASQVSPQSITMQINAINQRTDKPRNADDATLQLIFRNNSKEAISIPFYFPAGKGAHENKPRNFELSRSSSNGIHFGGSYASLNYSWTSAHDKSIEGICESSAFLEIPVGQDVGLDVPIKAPTKSGKYILTVHFDNNQLRHAAKLWNQPQDNQNEQYISLSTETAVELGP